MAHASPAEAHHGSDTCAPVTYAKTLLRNLSTMVGLSSFVVAWLATCGEPPWNKACACVCVSACACASVRVGCSCRSCWFAVPERTGAHSYTAHNIATAEWLRAPPLRGRRRACVLVRLGRVGAWAGASLRTRARFRLQSSVGVSRSTYESKERTLLGRSAREVASHLCRRTTFHERRTTDERATSRRHWCNACDAGATASRRAI